MRFSTASAAMFSGLRDNPARRGPDIAAIVTVVSRASVAAVRSQLDNLASCGQPDGQVLASSRPRSGNQPGLKG
jgi:hypothetical protein